MFLINHSREKRHRRKFIELMDMGTTPGADLQCEMQEIILLDR